MYKVFELMVRLLDDAVFAADDDVNPAQVRYLRTAHDK
jgi:hypothetical protein